MDWPTIHPEAEDAKHGLVASHRVVPLPAYNRVGALIPPDAYRSSLAGATVRVGFTLTHWYFQKRGDSIPSNTFTADIASLRVLIDPTRSQSPRRRKIMSHDPGIQQVSSKKRKTTN
jgi:hypothetical protein